MKKNDENQKLREKIFKAFTNKIFHIPLFYKYKGGIRFELSDDNCSIRQFLTAFEKSKPIINKIIGANSEITVCLRARLEFPIFKNRWKLKHLKNAGVTLGKNRDIWIEEIKDIDLLDSDGKNFWVYIAFHTPVIFIDNFMWCALSNDLGVIKPAPGVMVYFFDIDRGIAIYPYDARGMDVVGNNHNFLRKIYDEFKENIFHYDAAKISSVFESKK